MKTSGKRKAGGDAAPATSGGSRGAATATVAEPVSKKARKDAGGAGSGAGAAPSWSPSAGPVMNAAHTAAKAVSSYAAQFNRGQPFRHLVVRDMFPDPLLQQVRRELLATEYVDKKNDLYDFKQSAADLRKADGNAIATLRDAIYSPAFRSWLEGVTGIAVSEKVDMSAAQYTEGSYLLCHDDDLAGRRIAYILYFVPEDWAAEDGGALDLFSVDGRGMPDRVVRTITPAWGTFAFFEVSPVSFHQVAEVLSSAKGPRLSISGWFHGKPITRPPLPAVSSPRFLAPAPIASDDDDDEDEEEDGGKKKSRPLVTSARELSLDITAASLAEWVNPQYLRRGTIAAVAAQYSRDASVQLSGFLRPERYAAVMAAMGTQAWRHKGPAIMCNYRQAYSTSDDDAKRVSGMMPDAVFRLFRLLTSAPFLHLLSMLTSTPLADVAGEVRAFGHGDYTLITDAQYKADLKRAKAERVHGSGGGAGAAAAAAEEEEEEEEEAAAGPALVDATFCCVNDGEWDDACGGFVSFLSRDEELLSVPPAPNTLALVARDPSVLSFVKYVSHNAPETRYDVALQYRAADAAGDEDEDE